MIVGLLLSYSPARSESVPWPRAKSHLSEATEDPTEVRKLIEQKKWAEAAIILRSMYNRNPSNLSVTLALVNALGYTGRREEALAILNQSVAREKGHAQRENLARRAHVLAGMFFSNEVFQVFQDGVNLLRLDKYSASKERFEKALDKERDNAEILLRLGQALVLSSDYDSAVERLKLARHLDPGEPEIHLWLGRTLSRRGEQKAGLTELKLAYRELPQSERAAIWYGEALFEAGQKGLAFQILEKDARSHPFHLNLILALARLRMEGGPSLDSLWAARKELQLIFSRLGQNSGELAELESSVTEGELGIEFSASIAELREAATKLMGQVEEKIKTLENVSE